METRFLPLARSSVKLNTRDEGKRTLFGYGAVFYDGTPGTEYPLWSDVVERIMPGAFQRVITEKMDVRGLFNHNPDYLLGRVGSGTCRLSVDTRGLAYEIDAPDTQLGRDLAALLERQDITGSSFSFVSEKVMWVRGDNGVDIREIHSAIVYDVGPVTWPAYEGTTAAARSRGDSSELRKEWQEWRAGDPNAADEIDVRLRLLGLEE